MIGEQEILFKIFAEDAESSALSGKIPMTEDILTSILIKIQDLELHDLWEEILMRYEDTVNVWEARINEITISEEKIQEIKDKTLQYLTEKLPGFQA